MMKLDALCLEQLTFAHFKHALSAFFLFIKLMSKWCQVDLFTTVSVLVQTF